MRTLGRALQIVGLTILPLALLLNLTPAGRDGEPLLRVGQQMLFMVVGGLAAFWLGRLIEGYSKNT